MIAGGGKNCFVKLREIILFYANTDHNTAVAYSLALSRGYGAIE